MAAKSPRTASAHTLLFACGPLSELVQAIRLQLAQRLGISPRCVQVWFQNRRQKWKATQLAMGITPPALKTNSSRLTDLNQLLPYASGPDAQRAFMGGNFPQAMPLPGAVQVASHDPARSR